MSKRDGTKREPTAIEKATRRVNAASRKLEAAEARARKMTCAALAEFQAARKEYEQAVGLFPLESEKGEMDDVVARCEKDAGGRE